MGVLNCGLKRKVCITRVPGTSRVTDTLIHGRSVNLSIARGLAAPIVRALRAFHVRKYESNPTLVPCINRIAEQTDSNDCDTRGLLPFCSNDSACSICAPPPGICNQRGIGRK